LEQADKLRQEITEAEEELKAKRQQLEKFEQARKLVLRPEPWPFGQLICSRDYRRWLLFEKYMNPWFGSLHDFGNKLSWFVMAGEFDGDDVLLFGFVLAERAFEHFRLAALETALGLFE